jgi:hypothetical protein
MCLIVWCLVNSRRGRDPARGHYDSVYNHIINIVDTNANAAVAVAVFELICVLGV